MGQLTNLFVSESYQGLLKLTDSTTGVTATLQYVQDGIGNDLPIQVSSTEVIITGSLIGTASYATQALSASWAPDLTETGSFLITGSVSGDTLTFTKGDGSTFDLQVETGSLPNGVVSGSQQIVELGFATTSSLETLSGSIAITDLAQDGRLNSLETETGSLQSQIDEKLNTSSFNTYSGNTLNLINTKLDSSSFNSYTSSNDGRVSSLESKTGSYATTGSNIFIGTQTVTGSLDVTGEITALSASITYLRTIYQTSSVIYTSGSNILGDEASDVQTLNGTVDIPLGNLNVTGATTSSLGFFGNLEGTASYATEALSASYAPSNPLPSGLVSGSSQISYTGITDVPSGLVSSSVQVSDYGFATTSSVDSLTGSINSLNAATSSYVTETESGSFVTNVAGGLVSFEDQIIITKGDGSSSTVTINNVTNADSASYATNALSASYVPLPSGLVSGSSQISYTGITDIPSGIISGSVQVVLQDTTGNLSGSRIDGAVSLSTTSSYAESAIASNVTFDDDLFAYTASNVQTALQQLSDNKADISQLTSNITTFPTNTSADVGGYFALVTSSADIRYNVPAVDIPTGDITTTGQLIASLITDSYLFLGDPGLVNINTNGQIRRVAGSGTAEFYYEVYSRSGSTETLISTSNKTPPVDTATYSQFSAAAILDNGIFTEDDRIVLKFYGDRIAGGSDPSYEFQFGGDTPVKTLFPVPASVLISPWDGQFTGNASITGSLIVTDSFTSSLQDGYVWVGDSSGKNVEVSTSSFIEDLSQYATTGSNNFIGNQIIDGNVIVTGSLSVRNGDLDLISNNTTVNIDTYLTSGQAGQVNIIKGWSENPAAGGPLSNQANYTGSLSITGSNNIVSMPQIRATAIGGTPNMQGYISGSDNTIAANGSGIFLDTNSLLRPKTTNNYVGANANIRMTFTTSSLPGGHPIIINNTLYAGVLNINHPSGSVSSVNGNLLNGGALTSTQTFVTNNKAQIGNNIVGSQVTLNHISSSINYTGNLSTAPITVNNHLSSSIVQNTLTVGSNTILGGSQGQGHFIYVSGSQSTNATRAISDNLIGGRGNIVSSSYVGSSNSNLYSTLIYGQNLSVSGSNTTFGGSAFLGRYNDATTLNSSADIVFAVGTGTSVGARRTGLWVTSGSQTNVSGSLNIIGSTTITGSVQGNVNSLSVLSNTASLDLNTGNFFELQLIASQDIRIEPSNIKPGQTINIKINTEGSGTVSFPTSVKEVSGSPYVPTTTTGTDIITLVSFDSSDLYLANIKNLV